MDDGSTKKKQLKKPSKWAKDDKQEAQVEESPPGPSRQRSASRYLKSYERRTALADQLVYFSAPKFVQPLHDVQVPLGSTVTMTVDVEGTPPPKITFYKNGELLSVAGDDRLEVQELSESSWALIIRNVAKSDDAEYACCAHSIVGEAWCYGDLFVIDTGL